MSADGANCYKLLCHFLTGTEISLYGYYSDYLRGSAPVHMSNVQCSGNESRLIDCPHNSGGSGSDALLRCNYYNSYGK